MRDRRGHEWGTIPKRKQRFFKSGGSWYYDTREGSPKGPFDFLPEAQMDANEYVLTCQKKAASKPS